MKRCRTYGYRTVGDVVGRAQCEEIPDMWLVGHSVRRYRTCGYRTVGDVAGRAQCEEIQDMWLSYSRRCGW